MPMPVSRTVNRRSTSPSGAAAPTTSARTTTSPASVNLMALPTRLSRTCRSRRPLGPPFGAVGRDTAGRVGLAGWVEQRALDLEGPAGAALEQIDFFRLQGRAGLQHLPVELLLAPGALLREDVEIGLAQDL